MTTPRITLDLAHRLLGHRPEELEREEKRVVEGIAARAPISLDAHELAERDDRFWDRMADGVARIGGSWPFIFGFFLFLAVWVSLNTLVLARSDAAFDPYPYIFLNLVLSMLAAIQAPIIMMSQNRQAEKDRIAAAHDYEVNLRSEIELLGLQEKMDLLRGEQHQRIIAQSEEILEQLQLLVGSQPRV